MPNQYSLTHWIIAVATVTLFTAPAHADVVLTSTAQRTALLELYTSEGCSSCPPADRWLGQFKTDPRVWRELVPVAFHVHYWDYLGWRDRFARKEYSARQERYAAVGGIRTVYTPGLILNGREWRGWFDRDALPSPTAETVGVLSAHIGDQLTSVTFSPATRRDEPLQINVAWLGFDLVTDVGAGENGNRRLEHDFVVLALHTLPASPNHATRAAYQWQLNTETPNAAAQGIAVWVSRIDDPTPLQAVGGWVNVKK